MPEAIEQTTQKPVGSIKIIPTDYPVSPPLSQCLDHFFEVGPDFDTIAPKIEPPHQPLALLEQLGPSPFERGRFPLIGFLATTYDKVSRYAQERH